MQTLSTEDMTRILAGGEPFILLHIYCEKRFLVPPLPGSLSIALTDGQLPEKVRAVANGTEVAVVVYGEDVPAVEGAAGLLAIAGFGEVWTYSGDPAPWAVRTEPVKDPVVRRGRWTDPDSYEPPIYEDVAFRA